MELQVKLGKTLKRNGHRWQHPDVVVVEDQGELVRLLDAGVVEPVAVVEAREKAEADIARIKGAAQRSLDDAKAKVEAAAAKARADAALDTEKSRAAAARADGDAMKRAKASAA